MRQYFYLWFKRRFYNEKVKSFIIGVIAGVAITGGIGAFAYTDYIEVMYNNIKIVVDGKEIHPDSEPFISNGTTYLPVRAVSEALGKEVYWDGPNYTVYIGNINGRLEYPTKELNINDNIGDYFWESSKNLKDNYGNSYSNAIYCDWANTGYSAIYEKLCNMQYSRFKGTIYVENGVSDDINPQVIIKADGKTIYTSPEITKTSRLIPIDITGCNDFQIILTQRIPHVHIGDGGFYQ